jgi:hypothetical protein
MYVYIYIYMLQYTYTYIYIHINIYIYMHHLFCTSRPRQAFLVIKLGTKSIKEIGIVLLLIFFIQLLRQSSPLSGLIRQKCWWICGLCVYSYMYMYSYIYVYMHVYIHTHICMYIYVYISMCAYIWWHYCPLYGDHNKII